MPPDEAVKRRPGRRGFCAHDHVALVERGAQRGHVVLGELVLVGERLELLLFDEAALGGLLDEALGRREVVQMNRVAQLNPSLVVAGPLRRRPPRRPARGRYPRSSVALLIYRTDCLGSPFPNIANLRFPNIHNTCNQPLFRSERRR